MTNATRLVTLALIAGAVTGCYPGRRVVAEAAPTPQVHAAIARSAPPPPAGAVPPSLR